MDAVTASNDETTDIQMAAGEADSVTVSAPAPAAVANGACAEHDEQEGTKAGVDWESMVQNEPGRTEIPLFLDACGRHEAASDRFAQGLDVLHGSLTASSHALVNVVSCLLQDRTQHLYDLEQDLKSDYVSNESVRASMNARLHETARAASQLFSRLLMAVDSGSNGSAASLPDALMQGGGPNDGAGGATATANPQDDGAGGTGLQQGEHEEPDWSKLVQHEPAKTQVPIFLEAREKRDVAASRFESAIEEYQASLEGYVQELTQIVADLYNQRSVKLEEFESVLKHEYATNDKVRNDMHGSLVQSRRAADAMYLDLMQRVMMSDSQQTCSGGSAMGTLTQATCLE